MDFRRAEGLGGQWPRLEATPYCGYTNAKSAVPAKPKQRVKKQERE